ncbi:MAG: hypothetical protein ABL928_04340 [Sphingorhabdus sp.]
MDMDFPHPRRALSAGSRKADYAALVATATSRQATSQTVSALLSPAGLAQDDTENLVSRIAYFSQRSGNRAATARGAFWIPDSRQLDRQESGVLTKLGLAVNLAGSTNGNSIQSYTIKPDYQVAERGTEL